MASDVSDGGVGDVENLLSFSSEWHPRLKMDAPEASVAIRLRSSSHELSVVDQHRLENNADEVEGRHSGFSMRVCSRQRIDLEGTSRNGFDPSIRTML